jgi:hypothetical protein
MTALIVILVILAVVVIAVAAVAGWRRRLRRQFGPEYDRAVAEKHGVLRAEAELTGRHRRVRRLDIRPLSADARRRYAADWTLIQERFVDAPQAAVLQASTLVATVMTERGYPNADDEQAMADLSVDHAETVGHFRAARQITAQLSDDGDGAYRDADTEALRQALIHYRALFAALLGEPDAAEPPLEDTERATASPAPEQIGEGSFR